MRESISWKLAAVTTVFATFAVETPAFAGPEDREQCAAAAEDAQKLRDEGKYRRAREQMLVCARDVCPGPIKSDCGKWLTDVDRDAPTVVFGAKDSKGDLADVKVTMDGVSVQDRLDGKPVLVDSGEHTFKFETKDGQVQEQKVVLRAAEKARPIIVTFGAGTSGHPTSNNGGTSGNGDQGGGGGSLVLPIALGVLAVGGITSFAVFGLIGKGDVDDLQKCKPNCNPNDVDSARTKLIIADISLGIGVVAAAVSAYLFITHKSSADATVKTGAQTDRWFSNVRVDGGPIAGGAMTGLSAKF
jgi:hypothetical protein